MVESGQQERELELVVFGATGFTGGMVASYLAHHARPDLRWAVAGRSRAKLLALREGLSAACPGRPEPSVIEADVSDPDSLQRLAARTRVVLTTVGPFVDHGEPLVRACIAEGTDYIDSSGEREFVREMIARHDQEARARGVRLVMSCGFDSIPTDMGVYYTIKQLPEGKPIEIQGYMQFLGVFSGGTELSAIKSLAGPKLPASAYCVEHGGRTLRVLPARVRRAAGVDGWMTPFDTVDPLIVLRSAEMLEGYGPDFRYTHHMVHKSLFAALFVLAFIAWIAILAKIPPLRAVLLKGIKKSGEGPTEAEMDAGFFKLRLHAACDDRAIATEVAGGDPGYRETSMMLSQCALCLVDDRQRLPERSGLLTPATAFGDLLLSRLSAGGMTFRVLEA